MTVYSDTKHGDTKHGDTKLDNVRLRITAATALMQTMVMAYRGLVKFRRSPQQLYDVIILPIVGTVLFASIFGGVVAGSVNDYLPFLIPGVLVQIVVTVSVVTGVQLCDDINKGIFDRFNALPVARIAPLAGSLLASTTRYAIAAVMTVIVGYIMGYRPESILGLVLGCILVVFAGFVVSWIFALLGVLLSEPSAVQGLSMLVLTPLMFASNALVPIETMPDWMQTVARFNPISKLVSAIRELTMTGTVGADTGWALLGCAVILAIFVPLTVHTYMRRST
ncbi:ABC transporter permease [Hoyosella rhizosphaerae]|uniref:Transport permease protein n=1 Tax=Hoyosella rhizosphaerae TaxID=1755582 RepID=A0A916UAW7_9ACTN|nr:ABC transporter permease [Hoyosella rhizosphaerae]GGC65503.1 transport permease protein [Hoyosella rhizosphaerae]